MSRFGELLRKFRSKSNDPNDSIRRLTQERLGQLLGMELDDHGYSGAAVSDWERGKSKIHADDRRVLTGLIKVLYEQGGIKTLQEANQLLEAGNYRVLNADETSRIFPDSIVLSSPNELGQPHPTLRFIARSFFSVSDDELKTMLMEAEQGPSPAWPRAFVSLINKLTARWSALHAALGMAWIWVWLLCWASLTLSLKWPFDSQQDAKFAVIAYSTGALIIPLLIGLLTSTRRNKFWEEHKLDNALLTRLYTYQGAYIGYHLGYFVIFMIRLFAYYADVNFTVPFQLLIAALPLLVGYTGARLVPYNLWQAYGRLSLGDGWIFFVFLVLGPIWGFYFYNSYSIFLSRSLGTLTVLLVLTIFMVLALLRRNK